MEKRKIKIFTLITIILLTIMATSIVAATNTDNTNNTIVTDNTQHTTQQVANTQQDNVKNVEKTITKSKQANTKEATALYDDIKQDIDSIDDTQTEETIELESASYVIDYTLNWGTTSTTKTLNINGNGASLHGQNQHSFITINEGYTLNLNNMEIIGCYNTENGGSITNHGTLNINNVTFKENTAGKKGGAIYSTGTVNIKGNSHFLDNHINDGVNGDGGAAIYTNSTLYIENTEFDNNIAEYTDDSSASNGANGGAISVINSTSDFIIESSTFTNNKGRHGGAIIIDDNQGRNQGTKKINNTVFKYNQATYGGAIEVFNDLIIENSTFEENSVKGIGSGNRNPLGGAICVNNLVNSGIPGSLTVKNTTFTKNTAPEANTTGSLQGYGGAIYNSGPDSTIDNCTFSENRAYYGGAYYANTNKTECMDVTITNTNFIENTARDGAAIWDKHYQSSTTPSSMIIDDCQFMDNVATNNYGSTIKGDYSNLVITDTNISDSNRYAINLHMSEKTKSMNNVTINGLSNINNLQTSIPTVTVTDYAQLVEVSKQINNEYTSTTTVTILLEGTDYTETEPIVFENNTCNVILNGNGKTIDTACMQFLTVAQGKTVTLNNLIVKNAKSDKGAAIINHGTLTVNNCVFEDNQALYHGGAIYSEGKLTVKKTNFTNKCDKQFSFPL